MINLYATGGVYRGPVGSDVFDTIPSGGRRGFLLPIAGIRRNGKTADLVPAAQDYAFQVEQVLPTSV